MKNNNLYLTITLLSLCIIEVNTINSISSAAPKISRQTTAALLRQQLTRPTHQVQRGFTTHSIKQNSIQQPTQQTWLSNFWNGLQAKFYPTIESLEQSTINALKNPENIRNINKIHRQIESELFINKWIKKFGYKNTPRSDDKLIDLKLQLRSAKKYMEEIETNQVLGVSLQNREAIINEAESALNQWNKIKQLNKNKYEFYMERKKLEKIQEKVKKAYKLSEGQDAIKNALDASYTKKTILDAKKSNQTQRLYDLWFELENAAGQAYTKTSKASEEGLKLTAEEAAKLIDVQEFSQNASQDLILKEIVKRSMGI